MYLVQGQTLSPMRGVLGQEGMLVKFKANFFSTEVSSLFKSVIFPPYLAKRAKTLYPLSHIYLYSPYKGMPAPPRFYCSVYPQILSGYASQFSSIHFNAGWRGIILIALLGSRPRK